ncbi:PfkB family carbohydrate kinase [Lentilactobacillus hilgardii]|uniref:PfkB family carbohydrate kinase n=1 Tax=Lentilactobacillus hilgardii TaxID=1588 RepID=UPI00390CCA13
MSVTTFGELILRLTTHDTLRFSQVTYLETNFGGVETNVAVLLNQLGDQVTLVTKLPENNIADIAINQLRGYEIDTSLIARGGDRMGLYFLQRGRGIRLISVTYDRAFSAFAPPQKSDYDWGLLFMKINYFYISGITPTLSNELAQTVLDSANIVICIRLKSFMMLIFVASFGPRKPQWHLTDRFCHTSIFVLPMMRILVLHLDSQLSN